MVPTLLCLHLLLALLTVVSLDLAQAGSDASYNLFSKIKGSLGSTLAARVDGGIGRYPYRCILDPNDRVGIFWAGGSITEDDFGNIDEFIEFYTAGKGKLFTNVFDTEIFDNMSLSASNKNNLWWRAINRASKSFAASAYGGTAYVYMNPSN